MKTTPRDATAALVRAFYSSVERHFAFLLGEGPARFVFRTEEFRPEGTVEVVEPEAIQYFFLATVGFVNRDITGAITFGDREYTINTVVGPARPEPRFALWEWARALDMADRDVSNADFVITVDRVESTVAVMGSVLAELERAIALYEADVVDRILQARCDSQAAFQRQLRTDAHRSARAGADDAFRAGHYRRVVELLQEFEDRLTEAERKKLAISRRMLRS